jgi:hypothetical protein
MRLSDIKLDKYELKHIPLFLNLAVCDSPCIMSAERVCVST